jgi:hypothetical protein
MKTSELTGAALDWAVAKCEGKAFAEEGEKFKLAYSPSTVWAQGGPIIERRGITVIGEANGLWVGAIGGCTDLEMPLYQEQGPTPLIAATRCYVASEMGDEVEVPVELLGD